MVLNTGLITQSCTDTGMPLMLSLMWALTEKSPEMSVMYKIHDIQKIQLFRKNDRSKCMDYLSVKSLLIVQINSHQHPLSVKFLLKSGVQGIEWYPLLYWTGSANCY